MLDPGAVAWNQDFTLSRGICRRNQAFFLHPLNKACRLVVAHLQAALTSAIGTLAATSLTAASAVAASNDFFNIDGTHPPQRVAGPNFATATSLEAGTPANTVSWYIGEMGADPNKIDCDDGQRREAEAYVVPAANRHVLTSKPWTRDEFVASGGLEHFISRFQGFARPVGRRCTESKSHRPGNV